MSTSGRSAGLILRVWIEDASTRRLRGRLTRAGQEVGAGEDLDYEITVSDGIDSICDSVRAWLSELVEAGRDAAVTPEGRSGDDDHPVFLQQHES
jgi:hypothetical protein